MLREARGLVSLALAAQLDRSLTTKKLPMSLPESGRQPAGSRQNGVANSNGMTWIRITALDSIVLREFLSNPLILNDHTISFFPKNAADMQ